ncbi:MAG: NAD(P)H-hydrate dehydratase [Tissierellia bacterium]|nr:NAD(P)H-hydrate dehydratase [Tissierellia bacterium]
MKTGIDIAKIERFENLKERFFKRCFTSKEVEELKKRRFKLESIASIFSAKEAFSKAYGLGIFEFGFQNVSLLHDDFGKPFLEFSEEGQRKLLNRGLTYEDVSISHDGGFVVSLVLLKDKFQKEYSLKARDRESNKGDYGRVGIIAGSKGMVGANYLASKAALRTGAGLVYSIVPSAIEEIMQIKSTEIIVKGVENSKDFFSKSSIKEVMNIIKDFDAIALGPGLGLEEDTGDFVKEILSSYEKPIVLDADGINLVNLDFLSSLDKDFVLTPHPKEFSRLIDRPVKEIQANRENIALKVSHIIGKTILLKGNNTLVASPDGDLHVNKTGNPGMATAGSGDVLTGIIAGLLGQGYGSFEAAKLGAYFHGLAGDIGAGEKGEASLIAGDIINYLPEALR